MEQRDPPADMMEMLMQVDHALLSEAIVERCRGRQ
jgi:hypothetical protein